jgi:hypothetical protein
MFLMELNYAKNKVDHASMLLHYYNLFRLCFIASIQRKWGRIDYGA